MMTEEEILDFLEMEEAILMNQHIVYTNGDHGEGYVNLREVAHHAWWLHDAGRTIGFWFRKLGIEVVVGPRTLGEKLAGYAALELEHGVALECDKGDDGAHMEFSPKFPRSAGLVKGKRVGIVDDLLRTGSSFYLTAALVRRYGGIPVAASAVVCRNQEVTPQDCGVEQLMVLAMVYGLGRVYTNQECAESGPCSQRKAVRLRPGHGHEWIKDHEGYPTV